MGLNHMKETLASMINAENQLTLERVEILRELRPSEKERDLLLALLENNVNSIRRMRMLKECVLGRMASVSLDESDDPEISTAMDLARSCDKMVDDSNRVVDDSKEIEDCHNSLAGYKDDDVKDHCDGRKGKYK